MHETLQLWETKNHAERLTLQYFKNHPHSTPARSTVYLESDLINTAPRRDTSAHIAHHLPIPVTMHRPAGLSLAKSFGWPCFYPSTRVGRRLRLMPSPRINKSGLLHGR